MDIKKFIDELYKKAIASELEEFEIYYSLGKSFSVKIFNGEIEGYKNSTGIGVSLRGIFENKMGYSYTSSINNTSIEELINEVISNSKVLEGTEKENIFRGDEKYKTIDNYNEEFEKLDVLEKTNFSKNMEEYAKNFNSKVKSVNHCLFQTGTGERIIRNSKELNLFSKKNSGCAYISVIVEEGEETKTGSSYVVGNDFSKYSYKELAENAVSKALKKLGGVPVSSGDYPIIFDSDSFGDILGSFSGIFSAESIDKGTSQLKNKIGEIIASEKITLVDDPFYLNGPASRSFDDEGVATSYKKIIDKGVLKTYLHNMKTAEKFKVKTTGNAKKSSYAGTINIAPSNFYIENGVKNIQELMSLKDKGILITDLAGLHSGLNSISGDFSLSAEGFYFENGKIIHSVSQITIAGNFFELLKSIEEIGNDFKFGMGSVGTPSILVSKLSISGK